MTTGRRAAAPDADDRGKREPGARDARLPARIAEEVGSVASLPRRVVIDLAMRAAIVWLGIRVVLALLGLIDAFSVVSVGIVLLAGALTALDLSVTRERILMADLGVSRVAAVAVALPVAGILEMGVRSLVTLAAGG